MVALTGYNDQSLIQRIVALGINGCLLKTQTVEDLLCALDAVARNEKYFSEQVREMLLSASDSNLNERIASLKGRELDFLKHLCSGMTYNDIAAKMHVSPYTVEDYREAIFKKFGLKNKTELILFALKHKLVEQGISNQLSVISRWQ